ncbi:MAG: accessory factor UbiK family protein [Thauera sp.]|jgi:BMFP domain-containing protein YqiC|nr:accessory factor UbiK family protein [Thauera sp.]
MAGPRFLDDIAQKLSGLAANSPVADLEKNAKALLGSTFGKLDLVSREEFDIQRELLRRALEQIDQLERRVAVLEQQVLQRPES